MGGDTSGERRCGHLLHHLRDDFPALFHLVTRRAQDPRGAGGGQRTRGDRCRPRGGLRGGALDSNRNGHHIGCADARAPEVNRRSRGRFFRRGRFGRARGLRTRHRLVANAAPRPRGLDAPALLVRFQDLGGKRRELAARLIDTCAAEGTSMSASFLRTSSANVADAHCHRLICLPSRMFRRRRSQPPSSQPVPR